MRYSEWCIAIIYHLKTIPRDPALGVPPFQFVQEWNKMIHVQHVDSVTNLYWSPRRKNTKAYITMSWSKLMESISEGWCILNHWNSPECSMELKQWLNNDGISYLIDLTGNQFLSKEIRISFHLSAHKRLPLPYIIWKVNRPDYPRIWKDWAAEISFGLGQKPYIVISPTRLLKKCV